MKYRLLTKEQFENLHQEFAIFLASQQIDAKEWEIIKIDKPEIAMQELEIFSDVVWDDVLTKVGFLEHFSAQHINLFKCEMDIIYRINIKINFSEIDLTTANGLNWLISHLKDERVEVSKGLKKYNPERNIELFKLIEQGCIITKGEFYDVIYPIIV